jgi:cysteine desulfurase
MFGICISNGSACNVGNAEPSHVLKAIGLSDEDAHNSVRFTLNTDIKVEDIDYTIEQLDKAIKIIKSMS